MYLSANEGRYIGDGHQNEIGRESNKLLKLGDTF